MPQITLDGRTIDVAAGKTIIEAALEYGLTIPHFCWHPALSVAGNCRMCLVRVGSQKKDATGALVYGADGALDVNWIPKMQIACATPIADGMVVDTKSDMTIDSQNNVMEFLLVNHPLDCPICDEAGECKLQEYAFKNSRGVSRFEEEKVHKPKRVEFSENIMFDGERCIMCSRCIRFGEEVAKQPTLTFVQRGDHVTIETFPGTRFDNPYSMNVIDICPVGALTSIDFRFKARVWEMSFSDSVCPGCARGCNVSVGVMNNVVLRVDPRTNMHVNTYWMCDYGRLTTPDLVNDNRTSGPLIKRHGAHETATWDEAITATADVLRGLQGSEIAVIGSAYSSNEDNYLLARLAKQLGAGTVDYIKHIDPTFGDDFLRVSEVTPNAIGAHSVGIKPSDDNHVVATLHARIARGDIKAVILLEDSLDTVSAELAAAVETLQNLIVLASHWNHCVTHASIVLPIATFAENDGTFTNITHRVQYFEPAVVTTENERNMGMKLSRWDKFGQVNDRWMHGERRDCRAAWHIIQAVANMLGAGWAYTTSEKVFNDIVAHVPAFKGMSYDRIVSEQGLVLGKGDQNSPREVVYESHVMKPQLNIWI
ncbi:MAG: 2Fe-2S iron-sulfur cluster-binding protein [bacterium]|nr:2Fe-2S iron-sulfur cluster-binding protein [bacterium]